MLTIRENVLTPDQPPALITLAELKTYLGITDTSQDTYLSNSLLAIASTFESYCDTILAPRDVVETIVPDEAWDMVPLSYSNARDLTAITIDGITQTLTDYRLAGKAGIISRKDGGPLVQAGAELVVSYSAGFSTLPAGIVQAVKEGVQAMIDMKDRPAGVQRESVPDVSDIAYFAHGDAYSVGPTGVKLLVPIAAHLAPYVVWFRT